MARHRQSFFSHRARGPSLRDPVVLWENRRSKLAWVREFERRCEPDALDFDTDWREGLMGWRAARFRESLLLRKAMRAWRRAAREIKRWRQGEAQVSRCFVAWAWHPDGALMQKMAKEFRVACCNVV